LWLTHAPLAAGSPETANAREVTLMVPETSSRTLELAVDELRTGLEKLYANQPSGNRDVNGTNILLGTPSNSRQIRGLDLPLAALGVEGYLLRTLKIDGYSTTVVAANTDTGLLYGVFGLLRALQSGADIGDLEISASPRIQHRLLNHWDNLDRHVERGYAGQSLWDWWRLPDVLDPRYTFYARANASIGINGTVLNNVNAAPEILTPRYLEKAAALADVFRPWGIRVYLSVRFSSPMDVGGLPTADPLDDDVRAWWKQKAEEIYSLIPDFGGFLVKANSEGQPGPQDYGRTHADGANMLAAALDPHGGIVMWRAFVYAPDNPRDRIRQAYDEFKPLDGRFAANVMVQAKNGPLDFQPREPFHPLFGAMPQTPLAMEFQITKEYLGFSTHLAYLGTMWEEVLQSETFRTSADSSVSRVIDGSLHGHTLSGIAGVANIGRDRNWSGSIFDQANWYAFGRLAWNPDLDAGEIAREWLRMTFSRDPDFVEKAADMMMRSREAVVDYMTPLGLAHLMGTGHHYGPAPWVDDLGRPDWNPYYYHRADSEAIGFDRTASGSDAVGQYAPALEKRFAERGTVPTELLLWFHRVGWDEKLRSGRTLWEELVYRYDRGVAEVEAMQKTWASLEDHVDAERFRSVADKLAVQLREARWWRDACLSYFAHTSGRPLPPGVKPPEHTLDYYRSLSFPHAPGQG
jgi:alpha-glucuronidase